MQSCPMRRLRIFYYYWDLRMEYAKSAMDNPSRLSVTCLLDARYLFRASRKVGVRNYNAAVEMNCIIIQGDCAAEVN